MKTLKLMHSKYHSNTHKQTYKTKFTQLHTNTHKHTHKQNDINLNRIVIYLQIHLNKTMNMRSKKINLENSWWKKKYMIKS